MQLKTTKLTLAVLILAGSTTFVMADNHTGARSDRFPSFEELDINDDQMISPNEVTGYAQAHFNKIDANKDGSFSAEEVIEMHMMRAAEIARSRHAKMIEKLDKDGDGLLSFVEMQAARKAPPSSLIQQDVEGNDFVFVLQNKGSYSEVAKVFVEAGLSYEGRTEIKSGIEAGAQLVDKGSRSVRTGQRVHVK